MERLRPYPAVACKAGSFITRCGVERCLRIPGEICDEDFEIAEFTGRKCHNSLQGCCKNKCHGDMEIDGIPISHNPICITNLKGKRSHIKFPFYRQFDEINAVEVENFSNY